MDLCLFCVLRVCELFGETIRYMFGCVCYFDVECDGVVNCGWRCSIGYTMYGLPKNVYFVPVVPVRVFCLSVADIPNPDLFV